MAIVALDIPDELTSALGAPGQDLSRRLLEAISLEAYREEKLTGSQLRRLLGFTSRDELDGFLKSHRVWLEYSMEDVERDRATHKALGI